MKFTLEKHGPVISSIITMVVYIITMSRGVMPIDAGELAASQYYLGISHPSGYPLFNIIGFIWSKIPIGSVIFRLNLLCAIWVAISNYFLIRTAFIVIKNVFNHKIQNAKEPAKKGNTSNIEVPASTLLITLSSITGVLLIAFCKTWWIQAAGVEVYSLHIALLSLFFYLFLKAVYSPAQKILSWVWVGVALGLCFSNHLTSVLILPGVFILFLSTIKWNISSLKTGFIVLGVSVLTAGVFYFIMMNLAGSSPRVNYGNPANLEYLKRHVSGWQFQSFMNDKEKNEAVTNFFKNFGIQSGYIGLILGFIGMVVLMMKNYKMGLFWLVNVIATLVYASQYNIHDIENYFLLSYLSAAILISCSLYWAITQLKNVSTHKLGYAMLILPLISLSINYSNANQSKLSFIDDYTKDALNSVEKNAIIISREWDVFVSPAYYYHLVEHVRPDVTILDKELLRRSWYHNQIKAWDRDLALRIEKEASIFNAEVLKFERKEKYDPNILQPAFENYITAILAQYKNRPVYVSSLILDADIARGVDVKLPPNTALIPETYFFKVVPVDTAIYHPLPIPAVFNVEFTDKEHDKFQKQILNYSMNVLSSRVQYEMTYDRKTEAKKLVELMQSIDARVTMPPGL